MENLQFTPMRLPSFNDIKTSEIETKIKTMLSEVQEDLSKLEENCTASWEGCMEPLEDIHLKVHEAWGPISHLHAVRNSDELREAYGKLLEPMTKFSLRLEQSEKIFNALKTLESSDAFKTLSPTKKRILEKKLLGAKLSGINLPEEQKTVFNENAQKLSKLSTAFSNNVLDAIKEYSLVVTEENDMGKLPSIYKELSSTAYNQKHPEAKTKATPEKGPWLISLDYTSYGPFMENSPNSALREELYLASIQKASHGKYDNKENIQEILKLKKEQAKLLGFNSYAELSLASKMAENVEQIYKMTEELLTPCKTKGKRELEELTSFAQENAGLKELAQWDIPYWAKRLQEKKFSYEDDDLKPYFSFETVTKGLFDLAKNLFSITVKKNDSKDIHLWDENVSFYNIYDKKGAHFASFYLDPYSRPHNKRGGAWMNDCIGRKKEKNGEVTRPVAYLVCNFTPPTKDEPALLTFREVETLFHEFGHGLQHMLTAVDDLEASGINGVEWDAVELPSQFMENWCYHKNTLLNMAKHYKTGETLPEELYQKIVDSKNYMVALGTLRQLQFALTDLHLHDDYDPNGSQTPFDIHKEIAKKVLIRPTHEKDRFLCSFAHIFAGGYSAGYYSYKWAEILSADAFSRFEEINLDNPDEVKAVGESFKQTVLGLGGSEDPMEVFKKFRGREPSAEALLRHQGLA